MAMDRAVVALAITVIIVVVTEGEAKRGCANFGHSCYGGMGKRSDLVNPNEEVLQNNIQETENPAYVFTGPRSAPPNIGFSSLRAQRFGRLISPDQYEQMNKYFKEWIINYLRRNDDIEKK